MGICSYTWEDLDREKNRLIEKQCQKNTWEGSKQYCIFHDPCSEKNSELFEKEVEKRISRGNYDFQGYYFPEEWSLKNEEFEEDVHFDGATFQNVDFREVVFQEDANFEGTTFQGYANFEGAKFQNADFEKATFQGDADFCGANFENAYFRETNFKNAYFSGANFQNAYFGGDFNGDADFCGATFQKNAYFSATFQKNAYFSATFQKNAYFSATFQKDVDFREVVFQEDANFEGTTFQGYANFEGAKFQNANFEKATFQGDADFCGAIIRENIEFAPHQVEELNLRNAKFLFRGNITADLTKARFYRVFLENITFVDCIWPEKIHEEVHMREEGLSYKELETIYRNLKQNMQRYGNYSKAGSFYYREMECRKEAMREKRLSLDWLKSFGYSLLKYTCGYGEKPQRVIGVSFMVVIVAAILFTYNGISIGEHTAEEYNIDHDLSLSLPSPKSIGDFLQCLYHSFVTFTTLGYGDIHPVGLSKIVACAESFLGAFFIALFVVVFVRKVAR